VFTYADRVVELHKAGLSWHDASTQARNEYVAQFDCHNCSDSVTTKGYEHDGHDEPTNDPVVNALVKKYGLRIVKQPISM
jgi:hypothetical protein